jgi:hypothetical protein
VLLGFAQARMVEFGIASRVRGAPDLTLAGAALLGAYVLRVGYLGDPRSMRLYGKIPGVAFVSDDYFAHLGRFNCHLSLRSGSKEMRYKPAVKVSIAAACGANIVTTRDASAIELLGEDYPYYTEPGLDAVTATIEHARATLGGPVWRAGLERMRGVAERTRLDRLLDSYVDFFASFD